MSSTKNQTGKLRAIQGVSHLMALALAGLSLVTGCLFWANAGPDADFLTGALMGALPEILAVVFIFTIAAMATSNHKRIGTYAAILVVAAAMLISWGVSYVGSYMYWETIDDRAITQSQTSASSTLRNTLQADLARYESELKTFEGVGREDVTTLEALLERCRQVSRDECLTTDVQGRLATNKAINALEVKKKDTIDALMTLATSEQTAIESGVFSPTVFLASFSINSRAFLHTFYAEAIKIVLFLMGLWATVQLKRVSDQEQVVLEDKVAEFAEQLSRAEAIKADLQRQLEELKAKQKKPKVASKPKQATPKPKPAPAIEKVAVIKPKPIQAAATPAASNYIDVPEIQADVSTLMVRKRGSSQFSHPSAQQVLPFELAGQGL
mgnify:CR=1 FL=1